MRIEPGSGQVKVWTLPEETPDDQETVATMSLADDGDATRIELAQGPFLTEARRELHDAGWNDTLDRLAAAF